MSDFYILLYTCLYLSNSPQRTFIIEEQASCFTCPNGKGVLNREWPTEGPASHGERRADPVRLRQGGELPRSSSASVRITPRRDPGAPHARSVSGFLSLSPCGAADAACGRPRRRRPRSARDAVDAEGAARVVHISLLKRVAGSRENKRCSRRAGTTRRGESEADGC